MSKEMDLVLRISNSSISGAFFAKNTLLDTFFIPFSSQLPILLKEILQEKEIENCIIGSGNHHAQKVTEEVLQELNISYFEIDHENLSITLDVEKPEELGTDRIANVYGALFLHPFSDAIVIDMETALVFDVITKERVFLGGAICPSVSLCARALSDHTDKLPLVNICKPQSCLSRSTIGNIQSGIYYSLIGTIEKIVEEIISMRFSHSQIKVIATGWLASNFSFQEYSSSLRQDLEKDLKVVIDYFEPDLPFFGLFQILREKLAIKSKEKTYKN